MIPSTPPAWMNISNEDFNTLYTLFYGAAAATSVSRTCEWYFADQIMTPPKKKKSVLKTLYEKITGKLQPAPVPQLEPTKYQSIDDIVA